MCKAEDLSAKFLRHNLLFQIFLQVFLFFSEPSAENINASDKSVTSPNLHLRACNSTSRKQDWGDNRSRNTRICNGVFSHLGSWKNVFLQEHFPVSRLHCVLAKANKFQDEYSKVLILTPQMRALEPQNELIPVSHEINRFGWQIFQELVHVLTSLWL